MMKAFFLAFLAAAFWSAESFVGSQSRSVVSKPVTSRTGPFFPRYKAPSSATARFSDPKQEANEKSAIKVNVDPLVKETSLLLRRLSWAAWWAQLILTTVSSITLLFARNVISGSNSSIAQAKSLPNFLLAGTGIAFSFGSIFWTWATRRLSRRLMKKPTSRIQTANMLRKSINVGITINILGILFTLLGAEQIVGALAIKVLTTSRTVTLMESSSLLQPLDILVVQANTNTLFSHFASLAALLYLSKSIPKLDPPSVEGDERRR
jgi:hypothetical protein